MTNGSSTLEATGSGPSRAGRLLSEIAREFASTPTHNLGSLDALRKRRVQLAYREPHEAAREVVA